MIRKRSIAEVILLSIVTCGIYMFYWYYAFASDIKTTLNDDSINPELDLVLCILTCGIYTIYWMYKYGKLLSTCQERAGKPVEDNAILYLVLQLLGIGIVNLALMQSSYNNLSD
ncbi:MAG: DUF4234 domain-containing protein [Clostridia bacterium]